MLIARKFPGKAFLLTFVEACGIDIENDLRWAQAWDRLAFQYLYPHAYPGAEVGKEPPRPQQAESAVRADPAFHDASEHHQELARPEELNVRHPGAVHFWDALDPDEREALRLLASWRTFATDAKLMEEGGPADHVIVIFGGRVKICVADNDREHVLAVRGPGDLVGERAALRVSVRSATVVALEMVWALVIQTGDFAAFISAYPRALDIVQNIIRERHTEGPTGYDAPPLISDNCTVFLTDVVGFGDRSRSDADRALIREALFRMTRTTVSGIPNARIEDRGDGFMTVVPPDISASKIIDQVLKELPDALDQHNKAQRETARFQLRLAVTIGPIATDIAGVSGEATIVVARLAEAPLFKKALAQSQARLGVIVSPFIYEAFIKYGMDLAEVATYHQIPVDVKEFTTIAWMKLFDNKSDSS
jgi:CRP-like cAMP-binding protein